jgi:hypothetical protein
LYYWYIISKKRNLTLTTGGQVLDFEAEVVPEAIVAPMLLNLCVRLRSLQASNSSVLLLNHCHYYFMVRDFGRNLCHVYIASSSLQMLD